jgi:hypothetical protein
MLTKKDPDGIRRMIDKIDLIRDDLCNAAGNSLIYTLVLWYRRARQDQCDGSRKDLYLTSDLDPHGTVPMHENFQT